MSRLPGLFDSFDNLDQISPEAIASWIRPIPDLDQLEDYLANRILYPQTIPLTERDMQIDSSILREALKMYKAQLLNTTTRKILIPEKFLNFLPDRLTLVKIFIDAYLLNREKRDYFQDLWTVVLTGGIDEVIGSVLFPQFVGNDGTMIIKLQDKSYEVRQGNLSLIPCPKDRCEIAYEIQKGKLLGSQENAFEVYGGKLGLVVDGRNV